MRRAAAVLTGVLALLLVLPATVAASARPLLLDGDRFVVELTPLAADPTVQEAVANRIVAEADPLVDAVAARIPVPESRAGATTAQLTASAARALIARAATGVVESSAFGTLWREALSLTHQEIVAPLATGSSGTIVRIDPDGTLGIDLTPVLRDVARQTLALAGIEDPTLVDRLPSEIVFPVLASDTLRDLVRWTPRVVAAGIWLPALCGVLAVGSVLSARRRVRTVTLLGAAVAGLAGLALLGYLIARGRLVAAVGDAVSPGSAVGIVADTATDGLREQWWVLVVIGVLMATGGAVFRRATSRRAGTPGSPAPAPAGP